MPDGNLLNLFEILLLAFAMSADAFSTALGVVGPRKIPRQTFRLAWHFGLFQGLMPLVGWFGGRALSDWLAPIDHWVASTVLVLIGLHMLWDAFHHDTGEETADRSRGWTLVGLAIATSLDALAVGVALGVRQQPILLACLIIGVVAGLMTLLAVRLGRRVKARYGLAAEIAGGILLIFIGIRLFRI